MRASLDLSGIVLRTTIGVHPSERIAPRGIEVDLRWVGETVPDRPSIDYAEVCKSLTALEGGEFGYIEELGGEIMRLLTEEFPGGRWTVTVRKVHPPVSIPLRSASITLEN